MCVDPLVDTKEDEENGIIGRPRSVLATGCRILGLVVVFDLLLKSVDVGAHRGDDTVRSRGAARGKVVG